MPDPKPAATTPPALLGPAEPRPALVLRPDGTSRFVLTCDHAGKRIPAALGNLGLSAVERDRHIAWDRGAAALARGLSALLDAPLVLQSYSRLVIDCNRPFEHRDSIPVRSEETDVPGNRNLDAAAVEQRRVEIFAPFHTAIAELLDKRAARGKTTALVAVHSFTNHYRGTARPWDVSVLYHRHRRLAAALFAELCAEPELCVGDNVPYQVDDESDYGVPVHGEARGLPNVLVEVRQDHLESDPDRDAWIQRLGAALSRAAIEGETA